MANLKLAVYDIKEKGVLDSHYTEGYVNDIVEALEKQIPFPPYDKNFATVVIHYCPRCGEDLELHPNFCSKCGQALDWSD